MASRARSRDETTEVLLEAANFEPIGILQTSERLGLRTEGSNRWEKGVDPYLAEPAAVLASRLIVDLAGAELVGQRRRPPRACPSGPSSGFAPSAPTGSSVSRSSPPEQRAILERLGFDGRATTGTSPCRRGARAT